ncbi:MAG: DUF433 domain-containing protein [Candidatus Eremiobacteraeota bacterium]|nr:DUF433 domain-containing protein [Candidatus Eremiobacteraeota bacterium]
MVRRTEHKYIVVDETGTARVENTRFKVRELVKGHLAHGWSAEELQWQYPELSLAQVYAALAYFYDREAEFTEEIERGLRFYEQERARGLDSPVRRKLKALGHL